MKDHFTHFGKGLYQELGRRLQVRFVLVNAPSQRIYKDMAEGKLDGLAYRTRHVESYPGLQSMLRIPMPLGTVDEAAYTSDAQAPCLHAWGDLQGLAGKFTTIAGYMSSKKYLDSLQLHSRAVMVDSVSQALRLLSDGKVRYVIDVLDFVELRLATWKGKTPVYYAGTVSRDPFYLYLGPRHIDLAIKAETALAAMRQDTALWRKLALVTPRITSSRCLDTLDAKP